MADAAPKKRQGKLRRGFRWFRIAVLSLLLVIVIAVIWLNQIGLPEFVKKPILAQLRTRGIELEFDRIRLRWYYGIVAEKVSIGQAATAEGVRLTASEVTVRVNSSALSHGHFQVDGLVLRDGKLTVPMLVSNEPPYRLMVNNIHSELLLLPGDQWELTDLQGEALGCKFTAAGTLTNASQLAQLLRKQTSLTAGQPRTTSPRSLQTMRQVFQEIEKATFTKPPEVSFQVRADAANTNDYRFYFKLSAADARTRWGAVRNLLVDIPITPVPGSNGLAQTHVTLQFSRLVSNQANTGPTKLDIRAIQSITNQTPLEVRARLGTHLVKTDYAEAGELNLSTHSTPVSLGGSNIWHTWIDIDSSQVKTKAIVAATLAGSVEINHSLTNFSLFTGKTDVRIAGLVSEWIKADELSLLSESITFTNRFQPAASSLKLSIKAPQTQWGTATNLTLGGDFTWNHDTHSTAGPRFLAGWTNAWPFTLTTTLAVTNLQTPQVALADAHVAIQWRPPLLRLSRVESHLYDGALNLDATLDAATRLVSLSGREDFDIMKIKHLFQPHTQEWLDQNEFAKPPAVTFQASATLPAWTNSVPDWEAEVLPTLLVEAGVRVGQGSFRSIAYTSARTTLRLANTRLELPELVAHRPEGTGQARYVSDIKTKDYYWRFDSTMDPKAALPFFETEEQKRILNDFTFTSPPGLRGELWGRWGAPELTGGHVDVALTNVVYRGGGFSNVMASVDYTNLLAHATNVTVRNGDQVITADGVTADIKAERLWFTNVNSTFDPYMFTGVIGPKTLAAIQAYQFAKPPKVIMTGSMPFSDTDQTDLHFDIDGGPFHYWKFNFGHISGLVHWVTNTLTITNVHARGYDGSLVWNGFFDFAPPHETPFRFKADFTNFDLQPLLVDLNPRTNSAQGRIDGTLMITNANAMDMDSWQGYGHASMRDGFLWDIPMVGMFSGTLNAVVPGLGKTRVKEGQGDFIVTNSVVHTSNLELKSPAMRLQYRGSVDMAGNVDAEVEAELLRDAWVVGRIFSLAMAPITKAFVYKVTGTLNEPTSKPLYIPKLLLYPFKPFKVIKDLLSEEKPKEKKPVPTPDKPIR